MKLLLTSAGVTNDSIKSALKELVGKEFGEASVVYIPTAAFPQSGPHDWFVNDLNQAHDLGWKEFNMLELNGLPKEMLLRRLQHTDVIYIGGGNVYYLALSFIRNNLSQDFLRVLEDKVYVGVSAGSMVFSKHLTKRTAALFGESDEIYDLNEKETISPFNLFDWYIKPHIHSKDFPERSDAWIDERTKQVHFPLYAIDDQTAVRVVDGKVDVVSEGTWRLIEP
jgi:dipeptidase E